ncbi:uncharacterized protein MELLADRAFT_95414 [Melampsora larici-populina 98AG31]|uniref:Secreted protein n=1 Tax=Melampsora larici-populina (strain 98AG31 / pathotype 3-4-7) TaxID=747676 RepID=F4S981_MELLP|nr:uncharacterized protein MELLADRAFT_95414 [Melampsora larici-populina 98AG31]EGF98773.1 hypothetical protein MELLADRAFT_95414 [Melampsora larici-populina 98AG31]
MKLSSVAISASALALTASAAIVPLQSPTSIKSRSTHHDEHNRDHRPAKPLMNMRQKESRRSRIRSMYLDNNRHIHGSDVVVESYRGHGHDTVAIPLHHHSVEYVEGRVHRDHKRSTYHTYLPGAPYTEITQVRTHRPKVTVINEYVPGRAHTSIHEHVHYRRKFQHGSQSSNSPKRFSVKHGKPGKSASRKGDSEANMSDSKKQKHSKDSSDSELVSKKQSHGKSAKANKKSGKPSHLSQRSLVDPATITQSGVPGFIEVATPLFKSALAKAISGLTYSMGNGSTFDLGTSNTQSTQFFMSPMNTTNGQMVYRLRIPILDSSAFETVDHCATFAISPPGPLSLKKCGPVPGCSQLFSYDLNTGKLQPIYGIAEDDSNSNSTSQATNSSSSSSSGTYRMTQMGSSMNSTSMSNSSTSSDVSNSTMSMSSNTTAPSMESNAYQNAVNASSASGNMTSPSQNGTTQSNTTSGTQRFASNNNPSSSNAPSSPSDDTPAAGTVLYFVPAQGFYQPPGTIDELPKSNK